MREKLRPFIPALLQWIHQTLAENADKARVVSDLPFTRLPEYFPPDVLARAKVVVVDQMPMPPLSRLGLTQFVDFEQADFGGMTYLDTFFVKRNVADNERLHCHELIHVIQWQLLGPEEFLLSYAHGLAVHGYRQSPLEIMAFDADRTFQQTHEPFDAVAYVKKQLAQQPS